MRDLDLMRRQCLGLISHLEKWLFRCSRKRPALIYSIVSAINLILTDLDRFSVASVNCEESVINADSVRFVKINGVYLHECNERCGRDNLIRTRLKYFF